MPTPDPRPDDAIDARDARDDDRDDDLVRALAAARPDAARDPARALRKRALLAAVLGDDDEAPTVGRYVVEARVGAGGMGVVYRARDRETGALVALKVLRPESRPARARFRREAETLRALEHPQVVRYLDHGVTDDDLDYLVMEWLEGRDLAARVAEGPLAVPEALRLGVALAGALRAAHAAGVVHRDVKPGNVFLVGDDARDLRLLDFGIAKGDAPPGATLTATGAVLGSPQYMAPEQLRGDHDVRTDVYGLGATLFHALTGRAPFVGDHPAAVLLAVAAVAAPTASALRPDLSPAVDALLARMLAKEPRDRPRDMAAALVELHAVLERPVAPGARAGLSRVERRVVPALPETLADDVRPRGAAPVGRERAWSLVRGALDECVAESRATLVVVTGAPGIGKSHLVDAAVHALRARVPPWTVRATRARADDAGAPYAALRGMLDDDDAGPLRAHLDALTGRDVDDPRVLADRVLLAWLDLLDAWAARGPLALVLDDAWCADAPTLHALDHALDHLAGHGLAVIVTTRRAPDTLALGASLSDEQRAHAHLGPLGARSAARLARDARPDLDDAARAELVRLAAGDPSTLRELLHGAGASGDEGPRSLAERVWRGLMELDPELRRVLRAASIVGRAFWPGALRALLGGAAEGPWLSERLDAAVRGQRVVRCAASRVRGEAQYEFVSELVHRAAYELNTPDDLGRGHASLARWLAEAEGFGPAAIARHLTLAGIGDEALPLYLAAARGALAGDAPDEAEAHLAAARGLARDDASRGAVEALTAQGRFWSGRLDEAVASARAAMEGIAPGTSAWSTAASLAITAAGQRGDNATVAALARRVLDAPFDDDEADDARRVALCRAYTQLALVGDVAPWLRDAALADGARGADARAWVARARATAAASRSFDEAIEAFVVAHRAHLEAGDRRSAAQVGLYLGSYLVWSGAWHRARQAIDDARTTATRLGADYLRTWARYTGGKLSVELDTPDEAARLLDEVAAEVTGSARMRAGALVYASLALQRGGRWADAERRARTALAEVSAGPMGRASSAALCRCLVAQCRVEEAQRVAATLTPRAPPGAVSEFDELVMLARAEAAEATGGEAQRAWDEAAEAIAARASTLADPLRRNEYLTGPHLVARTLASAARR